MANITLNKLIKAPNIEKKLRSKTLAKAFLIAVYLKERGKLYITSQELGRYMGESYVFAYQLLEKLVYLKIMGKISQTRLAKYVLLEPINKKYYDLAIKTIGDRSN